MLKQVLSTTIVFGLSFGCAEVSAENGNAIGIHGAATSTDSGEDIVIRGHHLRRTVNCKGNNVLVDANESVIILQGECNELTIDGCCNTITVDAVASIVLNSSDNKVRWKKAANGKQPKVNNDGKGNKVEQVTQ